MNLIVTASALLSLSLSLACTNTMKARDTVSDVKLKTPQITMTTTFKTVAELPRCDDGSEQMSAYISSKDSFVKCRSWFWRDVKPGDTSANYVASAPIHFYEWTDKNTRLRWALPRGSEVSLAEVSKTACNHGWKLPTRDELAKASNNGLFEGLKARGGVAFDKAWTASFDAVTGLSKGAMISALGNGPDKTAAIYCVASLN